MDRLSSHDTEDAATPNEYSGASLANELSELTPVTDSPMVDLKTAIAANQRAEDMRAQIAEARAAYNPTLEKQLIEENKKLIAEIRVEHDKLTGVYVDPEQQRSSEEAARLDSLAKIQEQLTGEETDQELLAMFGMIDGDKNATLASPLFRTNTRHAFDRYISSVRKYKAAVETNGVSLRNQINADTARIEMHDAVANHVAEDLGLEFMVARKLVAKVRDGKIPGSGESRMYARGITKELEKYGYDLGYYMRDQQEDMNEIFARDNTPSTNH